MCTVSFIPMGNACLLTSNRDEKRGRKPAEPPAIYSFNSADLLYPRDGEAGGTWIAANSKGTSAVLLNGAYDKHIQAAHYRKSRGWIFLDILDSINPLGNFLSMNLRDIEPFTLIIWQEMNLYECRWDGDKRYCFALRKEEAYIWSSATLYSPEVRERRNGWFRNFLEKNQSPGREEVLNFHLTAGDGQEEEKLKMTRADGTLTLSVTSILTDARHVSMDYHDLLNNKTSSRELYFAQEHSLT